MLVQLRASTAASSAVATRAAFLKSNGTIVDLDGSSPVDFIGISPGDYYIVIEHRNHLAVMSSAAVPLPNSSVYDFTTSFTSTYGTNPMYTLSDGKLGMWAGDVDGNGTIKYNGSGNDRLPILSRLGNVQSTTVNGYYNEDVNMNGQVKYNGSGNYSN